MPIQNEKRKTLTGYSKPGSDQQGFGQGNDEIIDKEEKGEKIQKIEVEIVHILRVDPSVLPYIWKDFTEWCEKWENN